MSTDGRRTALRGIAASGGVAVGPVIVLDRSGPPVPRRRVSPEAIEGEVRRLRLAIEASRQELENVRGSLTVEHQHDYGLILEAHLMMHRDELVVDAAVETIRQAGINAEWALRRTLDSLEGQLRQAGPAYFRDRAQDVEHVGQHILRHLTGSNDELPVITDETIVVADDLTPADAARLLNAHVQGVVVALGTATSHTAILARALEIPAVVGCTGVLSEVEQGDVVVVDGLRGEVLVHPDRSDRDRAERRGERYRTFTGRLRAHRNEPARTRDGVSVTLLANVELPAEAALAVAEGAEGIGLYRTEFLYLERRDAPSEEEQLCIYADVVRVMAPRPVVFRTCDIGADKLPDRLRRRTSANPALGLRAIRLSLDEQDVFVAQVRAILRAAALGPVEIMLPLVSTVDELREARSLIERACADLTAERVDFRRVPVGIMIEVPSAVLMAEALGRESDFFSVGTNDLVQYALARDRSNPEVAGTASALDPSVLKLLDMTASASRRGELPFAMCGDMASDPIALPLVVGLGYRRLSVPIASLGLAREIVRRIEAQQASTVARLALELDRAEEVRALLIDRFRSLLEDVWLEQGLELEA